MPPTHVITGWLLRRLMVFRRRCRRSPRVLACLAVTLNIIALTSIYVAVLPVPSQISVVRRCDVTRRPQSDLSIPEIVSLLLDMVADESQTGNTSRSGSSMSAWHRMRADAYKYRYTKWPLRGALLYLDDVLQTYQKLRHALTPRYHSDVTRTIPAPLGDVAASMTSQKSGSTTNEKYPEVYIIPLNDSNTNELMTSWQRFYAEISDRHLYNVTSSTVDDTIANLRALPVARLVSGQQPVTSQFRLTLRLADGATSTFVPHRESVPSTASHNAAADQWYFHQMEKPTAELWTFHLDRLLGMRRAAPVVWRSIDVIDDVRRLASRDMKLEFYQSPLGDWCLHGQCAQYCGHQQPVCARSSTLYGSLTLTLPLEHRASLPDPWHHGTQGDDLYHPAAVRHSDQHSGHVSSEYCQHVLDAWLPSFDNQLRLFLDLVDLHIIDFLIGNLDRQHLDLYETSDQRLSAFLHINNAKGFVNADVDELRILTPLDQCCMVRRSTVRTLTEFQTSPSLSEAMAKSLQQDPLNPVLCQPHLSALDRRLDIVIEHVNNCLTRRQPPDVIIDD